MSATLRKRLGVEGKPVVLRDWPVADGVAFGRRLGNEDDALALLPQAVYTVKKRHFSKVQDIQKKNTSLRLSYFS